MSERTRDERWALVSPTQLGTLYRRLAYLCRVAEAQKLRLQTARRPQHADVQEAARLWLAVKVHLGDMMREVQFQIDENSAVSYEVEERVAEAVADAAPDEPGDFD